MRLKIFNLLLLINCTIIFTQKIYSQEFIFENVQPEDASYIGTVNFITQDSFGFLWIGTVNGLYRFDGYIFKKFNHNPDDSSSISGNHIWSICEDNNRDLWIGTSGKGLNRYIRAEDRFKRYFHNPDDNTSLNGDTEVPWLIKNSQGRILIALWENGLDTYDFDLDKFSHNKIVSFDDKGIPRSNVHRVYEDILGDVWIGTKMGLFRKKQNEENLFLYKNIPGNNKSIGGNYVYSILEDRESNIWVGTKDGGISRYNRESDEFTSYKNNPHLKNSLSSNGITSMCVDSSGFIWIGTDNNGLLMFNSESSEFVKISSKETGSKISSLFTDASGVLWVGTVSSGLFRCSFTKNKFKTLKPGNNYPGSAIVNAILESNDGSIWIGTGDGLYHYNLDLSGNYKTLEGNSISALCDDNSGNIWIGTESSGIFYLKPDEKKIYNLKPSGIFENIKINSLLIDHTEKLWIGTDGASVILYDLLTQEIINYGEDSTSPFYNMRHIFALHRDSHNNIWAGCWGEGILKYNPGKNIYTKYSYTSIDVSSISSNVVISIEEDKSGNMWFGTWGNGLNKFDPSEEKFTRFSSAGGMPNDNIYNILSDDDNNIWISTSYGIAKLITENNTWINYDKQDGLQSMEFRQGAGAKGKSGRFYFGGVNGFNVFYPDDIIQNPNIPKLVLTSVKISGKEIIKDFFKGSVELIKNLDFSYNQNNISFEFAGLEFTNPSKNKYAYILEGFDEDWNYSGRRFASYTNINPGKYIFKVKASNSDGKWNEEALSVQISVASPPWKTWWAYVIYILTGVAVLLLLRKYELTRIRLKNQLKFEHLEAKKLKELDQLKSKFFANISHEFRTPLTLIQGPIENAIAAAGSNGIKKELINAKRNTDKLLTLINQLLHLSKLESGNMKLQAAEYDLVQFIRGAVFTFESMLKQKNITLKFSSEFENLNLFFDAAKMEQVIYNLMSNAVKFTPAGSEGLIEVRLSVLPQTEKIQISVKDNGIGIPEEKLNRIFDRFFQVENDIIHNYAGIGIGLSLSKEIVELHNGNITAYSERGKGTEFIITLLPGSDHFREDEIVDPKLLQFRYSTGEYTEYSSEQIHPEDKPGKILVDKEIILIVEDNNEMRQYISRYLFSSYKIIEAVNGKEGFDKAVNNIPDLIISDIMMPGINGNQLCAALKNNEKTSHIPVILLTAKGGEESKLEGLQTGADDYLTKPFSSKELIVRVKNLIDQRNKLREKFSRESYLKSGNVSVSAIDTKFLLKVKEIIEKNLGNEIFSVEELASESAMSRMQLHRKLKALMNISAGELILNIRLNRAEELLKNNAASVSEIAYMTGFNTPNYFAKCFKRKFGYSPSEYKSHIFKRIK